MPERGESPPADRLTKEQQDAPADGQGIEKTDNKREELKAEVDKLESNPKEIMEDELKKKFA